MANEKPAAKVPGAGIEVRDHGSLAIIAAETALKALTVRDEPYLVQMQGELYKLLARLARARSRALYAEQKGR